MIERKKKICKKGTGKAIGFPGCGYESWKLHYGLCPGCEYDWMTQTEPGKIEFEKRKIKVKAKNWKEEKAKMKESVKRLSDYENEAKKSFQKWIRLRDKVLACISCDNINVKEWHASHYFDCNRFSGLIFDPRNVHKSCDYCNVYLSGNLIEYRQGLIKRHGIEFVEQLESEANSKRVYKYTKQELIDIKKKYDLKIKNKDYSS